MTTARQFLYRKGVIGLCLVMLTFVSGGCSSHNSEDGIFHGERVVIDWSDWLKDGASMAWKIEPGIYRLDLTASGDGVTAEWLGASCPKTQPMQELTMTCDISRNGQLIITNPSIFGLGANASTTVKVTKLR